MARCRRRLALLCIALLPRTPPPAGRAASLLCCRLLVRSSHCPSGGSRGEEEEDLQRSDCPPGESRDGVQHEEGASRSSRGRLLRRAWGKSLSPLERVSMMISKEGQDVQSSDFPSGGCRGEVQDLQRSDCPSGGRRGEVQDLHRSVLPDVQGQRSPGGVAPQQQAPPCSTLHSGLADEGSKQSEAGAEDAPGLQPPASPLAGEDGDPWPPLGTPFTPGDLLLAECKKKHFSMFRKMFLLKSHGKLMSNWGAINSRDIVGKYPGQSLPTSTGHPILLKRPSLGEYVSLMKRGPNIAYPKDIQAMVMAMDVSPGDVVLEAGSGAGACSLFLSRAVGSDGLIYSYEVRQDHHEVAKKNFAAWQKAWEIRSGRAWPNNVRFINKNIRDALPDLKSVALDAALLDMLNPQVALPVITGRLKQGAVCAAYIANITQVIDLLDGIRCCRLPLTCERIVEVYITNWLVTPAYRKDGQISKRVTPYDDEEEEEEEEIEEDDNGLATSEGFGQLPYLARPLPWQTGHTAFLVYLRKCKGAPPAAERGNGG